jgi:hypothetical protein
MFIRKANEARKARQARKARKVKVVLLSHDIICINLSRFLLVTAYGSLRTAYYLDDLKFDNSTN